MVARVPEVTCRQRCAVLPPADPFSILPLRRTTSNRPARRSRRSTRIPRDPKSTQREGIIMNWSKIETGWTSYTANAKQQWNNGK